MNARTIAYLALMAYEEKGLFLYDFIEEHKSQLTPLDLALAYELSCGTMRMQRYLDFAAKTLSDKQRLPAKKKERLLLRLALYQCYFLSRMPLHAIGKETIDVAKKYTQPQFGKFLNAVIRKVDREKPPACPEIDSAYSYPSFFVERLITHYGKEKTIAILDLQNRPTKLMARIRDTTGTVSATLLEKSTRHNEMLVFEKGENLADLHKSAQLYIQNSTQPTLIKQLAKQLNKAPQAILDLCAAPGGKTVLVHDLFPDAKIHANDVSQAKLLRLKENLKKYGIAAQITCEKGELLSLDASFDLIIVDAPCTNSGVLYKCPEARFRISQASLSELQNQSLALLKNAKKHLKKGGKIWYLTCSILPEENEHLCALACQELGLKQEASFLQLPNEEGFEGGFGAQLTFV